MAEKYLKQEDGNMKEQEALTTSSGSADAGKIPGLDPSGKLDQTMMPAGIGADTKVLPASEGLSAGSYVNIFNDSGTLKARKADASTNKPADGFVKGSFSTGQSATVYFDGTNTNHTGLTLGVMHFLSDATPGAATDAAPKGSGKIVQKLGKSIAATEISFEPHDPITLS